MTESLKHQIIKASAGTGKTYQLTHFYVDLLDHGFEPGSILASTFTRKAAHEIFQRVLKLVAENTDKNPLAIKQLHDLCQNLHRLSIYTLDSLFTRIGQCFSMELGLPMAPKIYDETDPRINRIEDQAITHVLDTLGSKTLLALLQRFHHNEAQSQIIHSIRDHVSNFYHIYHQAPNREQWDHYPPLPPFDEEVVKKLIQAHQDAEQLLPKTKKGEVNKTAFKAWKKVNALLEHRNWKEFLKQGIISKLSFPFDPEQRVLYNRSELDATLLQVYADLRDSAVSYLLELERQHNLAAYELAKLYAKEFDKLRMNEKILFFSDIPKRLAEAASGQNPLSFMDIAYRMDQTFQCMLLDEFQDTSYEQWQILQPMAAEVCSGEGANLEKNGLGQFFCVGDMKQAIFGWRGGSAKIFKHLTAALPLPGDAISTLNESFRSSPVILDVVNRLFSNLSSDWLSPDRQMIFKEALDTWEYKSHKANDLEKPGYVQVKSLPAQNKDEASKDDANRQSLHDLADEIEKLHKEIPDRTIGILVWKNDQVRTIMQALRDRNMNVAGEGGILLDDDPAVCAILATMRMAQHPDDSASAFQVLNSPMKPTLGLQGYRLSHTAGIALKIRRQLASDGYARTLGAWVRSLGPHVNKTSAGRLTQLIALAVRYEQSTIVEPDEFVRFVQQTPVQEATPARVIVMTIYKAKGLEFDAVVLPYMTKRPGDISQSAICCLRDENENIQFVYSTAYEEIRKLCPSLQQAYEAESARRFTDDLCCFYVAVTRPKHALYMYVACRSKTREPQNDAFEKLVFNTLVQKQPDELSDKAQLLFESGNASWYEQCRDSEPDTKGVEQDSAKLKPLRIQLVPSVADRHLPRLSPSQMESQGVRKVSDLLHQYGHDARARGIAIHNLFQQIQWLEVSAQSKAVSWQSLQLKVQGMDPAWLDDFNHMLQKPDVLSLFQRPNDWNETICKLWREQNFVIQQEAQLIQGQFDRVHLWPDRALLIDFKTDQVSAGKDEVVIARYRPQLALYCQAIMKICRLPAQSIHAQLVLLQTGEIVEIEL